MLKTLPRSSSRQVRGVASPSTVVQQPDRRAGTIALTSSSRIFAGTSGWAYPTWKPGFYPADISTKRFLDCYATRLNSVEVNYTFRKLPSETILDAWLAASPSGFRFSLKAPQRITHFSRLRDCDVAVAEFVAALEPVRLAGRLGPLLFQLPPNFKADAALLATFLAVPAFAGSSRPRIAFEFRHESWFDEKIYAILRANNAALCIAENDDLRTPEVHCAGDFAFFRLRCKGGYTAREVRAFAKKFSMLAETREVFVFFKHEEEPTGALNAVALLQACAGKAGKR